LDLLPKNPFYVYQNKNIAKNGNLHCSSHALTQSKPNILEFLDYIYNGYETDNIGLSRKYNRYQTLKTS